MMMKIIEAVRKLQEHILETGLARGVLALPAPRMLALPSPSSEQAVEANVFAAAIMEPEIESVARDLFASGHYSLSVQEAYKAVDKYVAQKVGDRESSGARLM
ncbi:MAG: hypothetical protein ACREBW_09775, partial [Candidatus Micrarchaeaceae archaeon]